MQIQKFVILHNKNTRVLANMENYVSFACNFDDIVL